MDEEQVFIFELLLSHVHWKTEVKEKLLKETATGLMMHDGKRGIVGL